MKTIFTLIFIGAFLMACNSENKQKQESEKQIELVQKENELLKKTNSQPVEQSVQQDKKLKKSKILTKKPQSIQKVDWLGTWIFNTKQASYILEIDEKYRGAYRCTYKAEGIQIYYDLICSGVDKENSFELYYWGTNDGVFYQEDKIKRDKPILTLKMKNGKILTYWNQLNSGESGRICFKKEK